MIALVLNALFAVCALASLLVIADSAMRGVFAWRRIQRELRVLSGECAASVRGGTTRSASPACIRARDWQPYARRAAA